MSCPESIPSDDHNDTNITIPVKWISPVKHDVIMAVVTVLFRSFCLHNGTIQEVRVDRLLLFIFSSTVLVLVGCSPYWLST